MTLALAVATAHQGKNVKVVMAPIPGLANLVIMAFTMTQASTPCAANAARVRQEREGSVARKLRADLASPALSTLSNKVKAAMRLHV
jgi:hypothetical protein